MRICIMTQPLGTNYGGLLQAYALQTVLKNMGHEVWTEDRKENKQSVYNRAKRYVKQLLIRLLSPVSSRFQKTYFPTPEQEKVIRQYTDRFIWQYITTTIPICSTNKDLLDRYQFEAYVIGSDQVWRPMYSWGLSNYFLDFTKGRSVRRVAYAASFGSEHWEFTPQQTAVCAVLVQTFDAISVREDSGVELCAQYLGVKAERLSDPTMLLERADYISLIEQDGPRMPGNGLLTYILDATKDKWKAVQMVSETLGLAPFKVMPEEQFHRVGPERIDRCIYPSVSTWLRGFQDADYVVTDSFHGTVFSILFEKPFVVIANHSRGLSRFISLLTIYGLESRLIFSSKDLSSDLIRQPIDWPRIREIRRKEKDKAMKFLCDNLS